MKHWKGTASALVIVFILVALMALMSGCVQPPVAGLTADKTTVPVGENIQFSNTSTGKVASWSWDFGDGNTSALENPFHAYAEKGHYTVSLTVANRGGSDTDTLAITVFGPPSAAFSASETKTKPGSSIQFMDKSTGDVDSWLWDFGDGNTSTEENPSHTYAERGDYTVSLTVSNKAGSDTETLAITVLTPPNANFSALETRAKVDSTIQFTDQSTGDIDSWLWDFGDGNTSTEQNPSHTYRHAGMYTVSLTVSNAVSSDTREKKDYITVISFIISRIEICSNVTEDGVYTPQPDATFHMDDDVWVYFEIRGFEAQKTDGDYELWVQWKQVKLCDPDGNVMFELSDVTELHETVTVAEKPEWLSFWMWLGYGERGDPLGEYRLEVRVEDKLSGETATESIAFILE